MRKKKNYKDNEMQKEVIEQIREIKNTKTLVFIYNFIKGLKKEEA